MIPVRIQFEFSRWGSAHVDPLDRKRCLSKWGFTWRHLTCPVGCLTRYWARHSEWNHSCTLNMQLYILLFILTFGSTFQHKACLLISLSFLIDKCILGNKAFQFDCLWPEAESLWLSGGTRLEEKIPKFTKLNMSDEAECGLCSGRILASFPCPSCEHKLTRGGRLHSSDCLRTRGLELNLGTAPASHTCMIPLECLVTSFSQRSMYTCVLGRLYLSCRHSQIVCVVPRDEIGLVEVGNTVRKPTGTQNCFPTASWISGI